MELDATTSGSVRLLGGFGSTYGSPRVGRLSGFSTYWGFYVLSFAHSCFFLDSTVCLQLQWEICPLFVGFILLGLKFPITRVYLPLYYIEIVGFNFLHIHLFLLIILVEDNYAIVSALSVKS